MEKCKECEHYVANKNEPNGSCLLFGNESMIKNNSTIIDKTNDEMQPSLLIEVGENFGCIHFELKF